MIKKEVYYTWYSIWQHPKLWKIKDQPIKHCFFCYFLLYFTIWIVFLFILFILQHCCKRPVDLESAWVHQSYCVSFTLITEAHYYSFVFRSCLRISPQFSVCFVWNLSCFILPVTTISDYMIFLVNWIWSFAWQQF